MMGFAAAMVQRWYAMCMAGYSSLWYTATAGLSLALHASD